MTSIASLFPYVLMVVHAALAIWGVLGLVEYFFPAVSLGLQNAGFPAGTQFLHFASILVTGGMFLVGYVTRWQHTQHAMVTMYAVLATICFIETVDFQAFGGGSTRFIPMTIEYIVYVGLSTYFFRSAVMCERFSS